MGEIRPWQIGVMVIAVIAVGAAAWYTFFANDPGRHLDKSVLLVDVETGQLWRASTKRRGLLLPEISPETGRASLYSATKLEDGGYRVMDRRMDLLRGDVEAGALDEIIVDLDSGRFEAKLPVRTFKFREN